MHTPLPSQDFREFDTSRFELTRWLLHRHSQLAYSRALTGAVLILADTILAALILWLVIQVKPLLSHSLFLGLFIVILGILSLAGLLVSVAFSLGAISLRRAALPAGQPGEPTAVFFQSGDQPPPGPPIFQSEDEFRLGFRSATREEVLNGAVQELFAQATARQSQERRFLVAAISFGVSTFGMVLLAMIAAIGLY